MIGAVALSRAAIVAWGLLPASPVIPAPPAPLVAAPAPVPDAAPTSETAPPPPAGVPPVVTEPVPGPLPTPPPVSAEIIAPALPGRKKSKKRDAHSGTHADGDAGRFGTVELRGRIFVLGELLRANVLTVDGAGGLTTGERDSFDIEVTRVRPDLHWQAPQKWLSAVIEVEVTKKPDMRDGYIQGRRKHFMLRAGQFKMPGSAIELASRWTLPFARRGLVHGLLVDGLDNAWRRPGVMLRWRGTDVLLRPEINAGVFQGFVVTSEGLERDKDLIVAQSLSAQSLIARVQIEPVRGVELGAYYHHRVGTPAILRTARYWTAGADLVVDRTFARGGLRIWLDGIAGASWFEHPSKPVDDQDTTFVAGRSIFAWRFGGVESEQRYLEAYGTFAVLDPDVDVVSDLAFDAAVGLNLGLWQRFRITAQGEIWRTGRNFPPGYTLGIDPDRAAALLQVGVNL